jgi:hypothetical protein
MLILPRLFGGTIATKELRVVKLLNKILMFLWFVEKIHREIKE